MIRIINKILNIFLVYYLLISLIFISLLLVIGYQAKDIDIFIRQTSALADLIELYINLALAGLFYLEMLPLILFASFALTALKIKKKNILFFWLLNKTKKNIILSVIIAITTISGISVSISTQYLFKPFFHKQNHNILSILFDESMRSINHIIISNKIIKVHNFYLYVENSYHSPQNKSLLQRVIIFLSKDSLGSTRIVKAYLCEKIHIDQQLKTIRYNSCYNEPITNDTSINSYITQVKPVNGKFSFDRLKYHFFEKAKYSNLITKLPAIFQKYTISNTELINQYNTNPCSNNLFEVLQRFFLIIAVFLFSPLGFIIIDKIGRPTLSKTYLLIFFLGVLPMITSILLNLSESVSLVLFKVTWFFPVFLVLLIITAVLSKRSFYAIKNRFIDKNL